MDQTYALSMWQERYAGDSYAYGRQPNTYLQEVAKRIPMGRVLCIAEGEGRNAVFLAEQGFQVTAVDGSSNGMERARRLAAERGVELETVVVDLADYAIGESEWEGIVSIFAHVPATLRASIHRQTVAGLKPGGVFVLEAYTPAQLQFKTGGPSRPELMMSLDQLSLELEGLSFEIGREVERDIEEGAFHSGPSATVQVLGVRPPF